MKKKIAMLLLTATLLPCNAYATEDSLENSYEIGLLSYKLSSDWIQTDDTTGMYKESTTFQNGDALLEVNAFEIDTNPELVPEENTDDFIDTSLQIPVHNFSELNEYKEISKQFFDSYLNTQSCLSSCSFNSGDERTVGIIYSVYYDDIIYNTIILAPLDSATDYSNTIVDFDTSLTPVEVLTDNTTVQKVQELLNQKGYDCGTPDGILGTNTEAAIKKYQQDNFLLESGKITNKLLENLGISDYSINELESTEILEDTTVETTVWISNSGSKYHSKSSCSNMQNPTQVTIEEAQAMGYEACKKCY